MMMEINNVKMFKKIKMVGGRGEEEDEKYNLS